MQLPALFEDRIGRARNEQIVHPFQRAQQVEMQGIGLDCIWSSLAQSPEISRRCLRLLIAEEGLLICERPRRTYVLRHEHGRSKPKIGGEMFKHEARARTPVVSQHQSAFQLPRQRAEHITVDRITGLLQMNS